MTTDIFDETDTEGAAVSGTENVAEDLTGSDDDAEIEITDEFDGAPPEADAPAEPTDPQEDA